MEARVKLLKWASCPTTFWFKTLQWLPILFRVEIKVLKVDSTTTSLFLSPTILSFAHHSLVSVASSLSLKHSRKIPVSWSLHLLFPLLTPPLSTPKPYSFIFFRSFSSITFLTRLKLSYIYNCDHLKMLQSLSLLPLPPQWSSPYLSVGFPTLI